MARLAHTLRRDTRGGAAVEFALLAPLYLLMLAGMLAYGLYFGASHSLQQLAADAARISIGGLDHAERDRLVRDYLEKNGDTYMLMEAAHLSYEIGADPRDGTQYRVTIRYDAAELPIWNLYPPLPMPSRFLSQGATIRQGGL